MSYSDGIGIVHPNAAYEESYFMLRFDVFRFSILPLACVSILPFSACTQTFDLGNTPTAEVTAGEILPGPSGPTGQTGPVIEPPPPPTDPILGAWVRSVYDGANADSSIADYARKSFRRDGTIVESGNTGATFTYQANLLTITDGGQDLVSSYRAVVYNATGERYPYLALHVFIRQGTGTGGAGIWESVQSDTGPDYVSTTTRRLKLLMDGTAEHSLNQIINPGPVVEPLVQPGTWSCASATECEVVLNGNTMPLQLIDADTLVDVKNDRWERAKTCETSGPITWEPPTACPPVWLANCAAGQTADWNGCTFDCVWPGQCDHVEQSVCEQASDCASNEVCNQDNIAVRKEDPALSSVYGLCIAPRTLCTLDTDCATGDFCSTLGQCEGL